MPGSAASKVVSVTVQHTAKGVSYVARSPMIALGGGGRARARAPGADRRPSSLVCAPSSGAPFANQASLVKVQGEAPEQADLEAARQARPEGVSFKKHVRRRGNSGK